VYISPCDSVATRRRFYRRHFSPAGRGDGGEGVLPQISGAIISPPLAQYVDKPSDATYHFRVTEANRGEETNGQA